MNRYVDVCLKMALKNLKRNELPIAAVIIKNGQIIAKASNNRNLKNNVMGHAEIICINKATKKLKRWNLSDCDLIVTLEPCEMCQAVIKEARIRKVWYLLPKYKSKKQYSKTAFEQLKSYPQLDQYRTSMNSFFKNKR